jgi:ribosome-binding protein aMBF1 (putative translation factor)
LETLNFTMMKKSAEKYQSEVLDGLLTKITPEEQKMTDKRMQLAERIFNAMKAKNISKLELARKMGKHASVITKWLSGTHNFTADTLFEIGDILGIQLINTANEDKIPVVTHYHMVISDSGDDQYIAVRKMENEDL